MCNTGSTQTSITRPQARAQNHAHPSNNNIATAIPTFVLQGLGLDEQQSASFVASGGFDAIEIATWGDWVMPQQANAGLGVGATKEVGSGALP